MLSPASTHWATATTAQALAPASGGNHPPPDAAQWREPSPFAVIRAQFANDQHQLSRVRSRLERTKRKQQVLEHYQHWLDHAIQQPSLDVKDRPMFVWLTLWHIDAGQYQRGLTLAEYALTVGLPAPRDFARTLAETICEEMLVGILKTGNPTLYRDLLDTLAQRLEGHDMTDQITAKLHKVRGLAWLDTDPANAKAWLQQALALDPKSGVKRYLTLLERSDKPTKPRTAAENLDDYNLSATAAARVAHMTPPAFIRHAKKYPDLLPRVEIPLGKRTLYRFNKKHVTAYLKQHLIKSKVEQPK